MAIETIKVATIWNDAVIMTAVKSNGVTDFLRIEHADAEDGTTKESWLFAGCELPQAEAKYNQLRASLKAALPF